VSSLIKAPCLFYGHRSLIGQGARDEWIAAFIKEPLHIYTFYPQNAPGSLRSD